MVRGMIALLTVCPHEVAHLRKELLIAARHILATELRIKFVPHMEKLFDENTLLGKGWTTHESLRPLAYSTLADLVSTFIFFCNEMRSDVLVRTSISVVPLNDSRLSPLEIGYLISIDNSKMCLEFAALPSLLDLVLKCFFSHILNASSSKVGHLVETLWSFPIFDVYHEH